AHNALAPCYEPNPWRTCTSDATLGGTRRPRVDGHVRSARLAHHTPAVRRRATDAAGGVPTRAASDQRPQSTALGVRDVRAASSTARWDESGAARPICGGHRLAARLCIA